MDGMPMSACCICLGFAVLQLWAVAMGAGRHFTGMGEMQEGTVVGDVHIQVETSSWEGVVASEAVVPIHLCMGLQD